MDMANNINPLVQAVAELPRELLELIMTYLTSIFDLLQCRGVCHAWRHAALNVLSSDTYSATSPPLLLLHKPMNIHKAKLLCLDPKNTTPKEYWLRAPKMLEFPYEDGVTCEVISTPTLMKGMEKAGLADFGSDSASVSVDGWTWYLGPSRGWLLLYSIIYPILCFFNPLTRLIVRIPKRPELETFFDPRKMRFIASSTPTEPTCLLYLNSSCRLAIYAMGDKQWTPTFKTMCNWVDMILYKGGLYSVDELGVLRRSLFDHDYSSYKHEVVSNSTSNPKTQHRYLVESWCGELLMLERRLERFRTFDGKWKSRTNLIMVYKLNWSNGQWEEVTSFGDLALFLTRNASKFVSVRYNPDYIPNSIYFVDDVCGFPYENTNSGNNDFGVYDLANCKVQRLNLSPPYPFCRWYQPGL